MNSYCHEASCPCPTSARLPAICWTYPNGVICLKGGDLSTEAAQFRKVAEITEISLYFNEEFFKDKKTVYVQI